MKPSRIGPLTNRSFSRNLPLAWSQEDQKLEESMSQQRGIFAVLKMKRSRSAMLVAACILQLALGVSSLRAQVTFQELYQFNCSTAGCNPYSGPLVQWTDGNLYGMANIGGHYNLGTIFQVTPTFPSAQTDLWPFDGPSGEQPMSGLMLASDGNLYGTTPGGGTNGYGTLFSFNPGTSTFTLLHEFTEAEGVPETTPAAGKDKNLYGVTAIGSVYTVTLLPTPVYKLLSSIAPGEPLGPLYLASDGNLYGTTWHGGTSNLGTIFRMNTPSGATKVIHNFTGTSPDGEIPYSAVTEGSDGDLYGTTGFGGAYGNGVVYKSPLSGPAKTIYSFPSSGTDGTDPQWALMQGTDGNFYSSTFLAGSDGYGTLFDVSSKGILYTLFNFTGTGGTVPGSAAETLMVHTNGSYYGVTFTGGSQDDGTLFSLTPINLREILTVVGPVFLEPGGPVEILGNELTQTAEVSFGSVQAQFQANADTYLTATVPQDAVDSPIIVTLETGLQVETQGSVHILPTITNLDPTSGPVGQEVDIVGGGFAGATKVTFGGVKATQFTILTPSLIQATVPTGAKTGKVAVTTPNGTATSTQKFTVN